MAHHLSGGSFKRLVDRLNEFPTGAPASPLLFKILSHLMSEHEAELLAQMPMTAIDSEKAARIWKIPEPEARAALEQLAGRAVLLDAEIEGRVYYTLPPAMAGFFEFSLMRVRDDIDQQALSELYHEYINQEDEFIIDLFGSTQTQLLRTFVNERAIEKSTALTGRALHVLDHERAAKLIETSSARGVSLCYCRHKMQHIGKACDAPQDICLTLNNCADSLVRHGHARSLTVSEALDQLERARSHRLLQIGENVREKINFICNCCRCCCEGLIAARKLWLHHPIHTTRFIPVPMTDKCRKCGACFRACPVNALIDAGDGTPRIDEQRCLGCGVCVDTCAHGALALDERASRVLTPVKSSHRFVLEAIERGRLQNLIFDRHDLVSHRVLATVLGVILQLPPAKQLLASQQFKSRFLEWYLRNRVYYG